MPIIGNLVNKSFQIMILNIKVILFVSPRGILFAINRSVYIQLHVICTLIVTTRNYSALKRAVQILFAIYTMII